MDAAWALPESPYDLLGVADDCSTARRQKRAGRDMARLFHPDRNTDAKDIETRTAHFLKIKKAYDCRTRGTKLYDGCLLARERLVRKNLYKYAVSNTPEFRDVVDAQFAGRFGPIGARRGRRRARAVLRVLRRPLKIPLLDLRPPGLRVLSIEAARV